MTGNVAIRRASPFAFAAVVSLALSACDDDFFLHPPAPSTAALLFTYAPAIVRPMRAASAAADRARIQVSRATTVIYDSTHALPPGTGEVRVRIELDLENPTETLDVLVELLEGTRVLARSGQSVELKQGQTTAAALTPDVVGDNLAVGDGHACYLDPTGTAYCWGRNDQGQLGIGSQIGSSRPVAVETSLRFAAIEASTYHTCALTFQGEAYCWGSGGGGRLGWGSTMPSSVPVPVSGGLRFASITTGVGHTCGLTPAAEAYCWGTNFRGEAGQSGTTQVLTPQLVQGPVRTFDVLSAGFYNTCGISDGVAHCWGFELGGGFAAPAQTAAPAGTPTFASLALGTIHNCALTPAGAAYCWGMAGSVGHGQLSASSVPVAVSGGRSFLSLAASRANSFYAGTTCGLTADGRAFCWGFNHAGQLGAPSSDACLATYNVVLACSSVPVEVAGGLRFTTIRTGGSAWAQDRSGATCGLTDSGAVYCWGNNDMGVLGQGDAAPRTAPTRVGAPVPPPVLMTIDLAPASLALSVGDSTDVSGRGSDQSGHFVPMFFTWTSSDTTRLIVRLAASARTTSVRVVARAAGPATLTASAEGVSASMNVIVN